MAKANPVTDKPADPATTPTDTVTTPAVNDTTPAVTPEVPKAKTAPADPLAKFKTVVNGLSIYNFTETAL